ncbi:GerAB/ArcD/ProY family transporter [Paenibacillus sp. LMG 31456]|uniref:GerAB/ArcD/ProY family transporter n=1 Tax=Paenibacillus foliorum TaxID=2654974 RepID=A0A972GPN1_9BACL|nr:endospore germination permease [Paenibacillus foliorum]NOU93845.1 GerAB/ArcD/ProY family transporter [Paenibacillus foliorum]
MQYKLNLQGRQFFILITLHMIGSAVLVMPTVLTVAAKQDAWISAVMVVAAGLGLTWLVYKIYQRFPEQNLIEITQEVFGKRLGTAISFLFFTTYTFVITALVLRNMGDFVITVMLPDTPLGVVDLLFLFVVIMGVKLGLRTTAYAAEIFFPWVFLLFFVLCIGLLSEVKIDFILPIFDTGIKSIIQGALPQIGIPYMESIIFLMITSHIKQGEKVGKMWYMAVLASGLFLLTLTLLSTLVLGPAQTALSVFPTFELAKRIDSSRVEFFMTFIWFVTVFFRMILFFYITNVGLSLTLKWRDYKFFSYPLAMLVLVGSILFVPNRSFMSELISMWYNYAFLWGVCFPILLLVISMLRGKKQAS